MPMADQRPDSARRDATGAEKAVALSYRPDEVDAPVVSAKGSGHVARQIVEVALAHGVPVREDADLVLDTSQESEAESVARVVAALRDGGWLPD